MAAKRPVTRTRSALLVSALLCACVSLHAEVEATAPDDSGLTYRFELGADGQPVFTQILRWDSDPNALSYRIVVRDASGAEVMNKESAESSMPVHLSPGAYDYKIITYNLLGKAEEESDWLKLEVIKAEQPRILSANPKVIYIDSLDGRISIAGEKLVLGGKVFLKGPLESGVEGKELERKGEEEIVVSFPDDAYQPGDYALKIENPGGLASSLEQALRIRYQRPVDILVSAGYAPCISLYDDWFTSNWPGTFYPLGFDASLELFFVKAKWGFIGVEAQAEYRRVLGGEAAAAITSDYLLAGADALYKYRLTRKLHGLVRVGGGYSFSRHSFDYDGFPGPVTTSADPFARAGLALQYFTPIKLFVELGADWSCIFLKNHMAGGITPSLRFGYQLY